jgi:hypothetical protein
VEQGGFVAGGRRTDVKNGREYSNHTCTNPGDIDAASAARCIYRLNYKRSRKFDALWSNKT